MSIPFKESYNKQDKKEMVDLVGSIFRDKHESINTELAELKAKLKKEFFMDQVGASLIKQIKQKGFGICWSDEAEKRFKKLFDNDNRVKTLKIRKEQLDKLLGIKQDYDNYNYYHPVWRLLTKVELMTNGSELAEYVRELLKKLEDF